MVAMWSLLKRFVWLWPLSLVFVGFTMASLGAPPPRPAMADDLEAMRQRAKTADLVAMYWLAVELSTQGRAGDQLEAIDWMRSAADGGAPYAQYELGQWYQRGFLVDADMAKAVRYWRNAAEGGYPEAMVMLAAVAMDRRDATSVTEAEGLLAKAQRAGSWLAYVVHAQWLEAGKGLPLNERAAAEKWLAAGRLGSYEAAVNLGRIYYDGRVVKQDFAKCEAWLRKAAHGGGVAPLVELARFLSSCPDETLRDRQEAFLLMREVKVIAGDQLDGDRLMVAAYIDSMCGQKEAAVAALVKARQAFGKGSRQPTDSLVRLNQLETAVKNGTPFEWPQLPPFKEAKVLMGDDVLENQTFQRLPPTVEPGVDLWWLAAPAVRMGIDPIQWNDPVGPIYDEDGYEIPRNWLVSEDERWLALYRRDGAEMWARAKAGDSAAALEMAQRLIARVDDAEVQEAGVKMLVETASRGGYPPALRWLATMHETGYLVRRDLHSAALYYRDAAQAGDAEAMFALGRMHNVGLGVNRDPMAAAHWLRRATVYGHSGAMNLLAEILMAGRGVRKDVAAGFAMLVEAAGRGYAESQFRLGMLHLWGNTVRAADLEQAKFWLELAAKNGDVEAQFQLAQLHYENRLPDAKSSEAARWALAAAQGYYLPAGRMMAWLYLIGDGVPRDYQRAEAWLRRAATFGAARDLAALADFLATCPDPPRRNAKEALSLAQRVLALRPTQADQFSFRTWEELGRVLAFSGRWQDAVDCEREAYGAINRIRNLDPLEKQDRLRQSVNRSTCYLDERMPDLPKPPDPEPGAKPLFEDTILQETDDKLPPMRDAEKPREANPNFPWEMDLS